MTSIEYHAQRRVLRQSTLPNSLPNNEANLTSGSGSLSNFNSVNLTAPTSPHQIQKSPLYPSAYNSDDVIHMTSVNIEADNYQQEQPQQQVQSNIQHTSGIATPTHHRLQVNVYVNEMQ